VRTALPVQGTLEVKTFLFGIFVSIHASSTLMDTTETPPPDWSIPASYDYSKSSELNYCSDVAKEVGKYGAIRSQLDYSYHKHYKEERQLFHDVLIDLFWSTRVHDSENNLVCEVPLENWIVFTAGPMGAGKGHTMQWLHQHGQFPMDAFVKVDPDAIRQLLPETAHYNAIDNNSTGYLTQKEVNYISEVTLHSCCTPTSLAN
jgi:hypothetical protein